MSIPVKISPQLPRQSISVNGRAISIDKNQYKKLAERGSPGQLKGENGIELLRGGLGVSLISSSMQYISAVIIPSHTINIT